MKIGFMGAGNMAQAMIKGLTNQAQLYAYDPDAQKLAELQTFSVIATSSNATLIESIDVLIIAVKPQILGKLLQENHDALLKHRPLILSIAAGIPTTHFPAELAVVRAMPNTAAMVSNSATGYFANHHVNASQKKIVETILASFGKVYPCGQESELDVITAISGSGIAYFYLLIEALTAAAAQFKFSAAQAQDILVQTALGAAQMIAQTNLPVAQLRQNVTSPQGTTAAALAVLEQGQFRELIAEAVAAAVARAEALAQRGNL